jgi:hypothetical protein
MNISDLINGLFEAIGAVFLFLNILALLKDKTVKGVSIPSTIYFTSWGIWNIYFYPSNGLWFSFAGGVLLVIMNITWVTLTFYFKNVKPFVPPSR